MKALLWFLGGYITHTYASTVLFGIALSFMYSVNIQLESIM